MQPWNTNASSRFPSASAHVACGCVGAPVTGSCATKPGAQSTRPRLGTVVACDRRSCRSSIVYDIHDESQTWSSRPTMKPDSRSEAVLLTASQTAGAGMQHASMSAAFPAGSQWLLAQGVDRMCWL